MPTALKYTTIAIVFLGLLFAGYKHQLHLPKPSLNPFDDQWEMRTSWLKNNSTSYFIHCGVSRIYEIAQGSFRIAYLSDTTTEPIILRKILFIPADTIQLEKCKLFDDCWSASSKFSDPTYVANMDFGLLDSICASFGFHRINPLIIPIRPNRHHEEAWFAAEYHPRFASINSNDTISFSLAKQKLLNDSLMIRDFCYSNSRNPETYLENTDDNNL